VRIFFTEEIAEKTQRELKRRFFPYKDMKKPPGNGAAFSLGRIVPTEAKPSELSGEILCLGAKGVKAKS
jgi:hypothetical protein